MTDREFLELRLATLSALLGAPGGPIASRRGTVAVARVLMTNWEAERQLLERIIATSDGRTLRSVMASWRERTERFIAGADDPDPSWRDKSGREWRAKQVLAILADLEERLDAWAASGDASWTEED